MKYAHTLDVLPTADDRNAIPEWNKGVYFVHKKNLTACFSFDSTTTPEEAHEKLTNYLQSRKDSDKLTITLIER